MNWHWFEQLRKHKHSGAYRAVGLALAIRAKKDDPVCFPSIETLCKDASVCRQTVTRATDLFEASGLLEVKRGDGNGNHYRLIFNGRKRPMRKPRRRKQAVTETGEQAATETGWKPKSQLPSRQHPSTPQTLKGSSLRAPKQGEAGGHPDDSEVPY